MILLRTKLFGFYDESGKLLEKYTKVKNIILSNGFTFQLMNQHGNLNQI